MAYIPQNSILATQGTVPWSVIGATTNVGSIISISQGSVIAVTQGSIATVIIGGSVAASFTPPANQSISGTVQAQLQSTNASVITVGSPVANQSISGTVNVGNFPTTQNVSGSVIAQVSNFPAVQVVAPNNSSLFSLQPAGSILAVSASITPVANQSVSGTVGASVIGHAPVVIVGGSILTSATPNQSVSGTVDVAQTGAWRVSVVSSNPSSMLVGASIIGLTPVSVSNFPTNQNVSGSVVAFQGGAPWAVNNGGSIITVGQGSIAVNIIAGSVAVALTPVANQSVSGTVGASIIGTVPVTQTTDPWKINGSVQGSFSVVGAVPVTQSSNWRVSVQGAVSPTATVSSMKAIASTTTLLASNAERRGATISNVSGTSILVRLGLMATVNNNTLKMDNNDYYEVPFNYSGVIQHFASSTAGFIQVTEIS